MVSEKSMQSDQPSHEPQYPGMNSRYVTDPAILDHLAGRFVRREKVVPVLGAGVSIPAGVPSGYYLLQMMRRGLYGNSQGENFAKALGSEATHVREILKDPGAIPSFEWILKVYSDVYRAEALYDQLNRLIPAKNTIHRPHPHFPTLTHELFAHFVGTRHFKYFITSNFDEVLETAIEEELGPGSCFTVASQSEFDRLANWKIHTWEQELRDPRLQCFILKPHGTISRRLSMRYTPEGTSFLSKQKEDVLLEVLANSTVLLMGFGNYNEDFRTIFAKSTINSLFVIDPKADEISANFPFTSSGPVFRCSQKADDFCREFTQFLYTTRFSSSAKPVRHELRASFFDLFSRSLADQEKDEPVYQAITNQIANLDEAWFARRIYELELLIHLFRTRGLFVDLAVASSERLRRSLERCSSVCAAQAIADDLRPFPVLDKVLNREQDRIVDCSLIRDRLNVEALAAKWIFLATTAELDEPVPDILSDLSMAAARNVTAHLSDCLKAATLDAQTYPWSERLPKFTARLASGLRELSTTFDIDIDKEDCAGTLKFSSPERIITREGFAGILKNLLERDTWNRIRIATVGAEWHAQQLRSLSGLSNRYRHIEVMSNLDMFTAKQCVSFLREPQGMYHYHRLIDSIGKLLTALSSWVDVELDWYAYRNLEHHLTVISRETRPHSYESEELIGGIYFQRRGKSTSVAPVFVHTESDLQMLSGFFDKRVEMAKRGSVEAWRRGICKLFRTRKVQKKLVVEISNDQEVHLALYKALEKKMAAEIARGDIQLSLVHRSPG